MVPPPEIPRMTRDHFTSTWRHYLLVACVLAFFASCGADDDASATCNKGERKCVDGKLAKCGADGTFGAPVACEAPKQCHAIDGKVDHCMVFADGMSHDSMMHGDGMTHGDVMTHGDGMTHGDSMAMSQDATMAHDAGK